MWDGARIFYIYRIINYSNECCLCIMFCKKKKKKSLISAHIGQHRYWYICDRPISHLINRLESDPQHHSCSKLHRAPLSSVSLQQQTATVHRCFSSCCCLSTPVFISVVMCWSDRIVYSQCSSYASIRENISKTNQSTGHKRMSLYQLCGSVMSLLVSEALSVAVPSAVCVVFPQAEQEALGTVCADREPAPGESWSSGPAGQAATLRPPTETDCHRGHGAPVLL